MNRDTRAALAYWRTIPRDYRSVIAATRYVLHRNPETGATELWPLSLAYRDAADRQRKREARQ